ncbi:MAG: hypothetical protein JWR75_735 [Devosia sp.]|nr:hypothetical protein [Devosia sp.]
MAEQASETKAPQGWLGRRLRGRLPLLVVALVLVLICLALGRLNPAESGFGIALLVGVALLIPNAPLPVSPESDPVIGAEPPRATSATLFADALADPAFVLDARTVVIHRNPAAISAFPTTRLNDPLAFTMRQPALVVAIDTARGGVAASVELHRTVPSESWYRADIAPLGETGLMLLTLRNLTEIKRIDQLRRDFIANVSHELRTPLTSLSGFIDTLLGPAANDAVARAKFLGIMRQQAERMARLIGDLLSLSRIEMRQHVRPTGSVDLASVLKQVLEALGSVASETGSTIELSVPDGPVTVTGDAEELYEVFENLIENALKYAGMSGPIEVTLAPATERPSYAWSIVVRDHGPGVGIEHVPRLTERFYRVDAEASRKKKGTGLGLAIVKHIVNRHHGELSLRSAPGEGMRAEVFLPR